MAMGTNLGAGPIGHCAAFGLERNFRWDRINNHIGFNQQQLYIYTLQVYIMSKPTFSCLYNINYVHWLLVCIMLTGMPSDSVDQLGGTPNPCPVFVKVYRTTQTIGKR